MELYQLTVPYPVSKIDEIRLERIGGKFDGECWRFASKLSLDAAKFILEREYGDLRDVPAQA